MGTTIKKYDLIQIFRRWTVSREVLHRRIEAQQKELEALREKVASLRHAKEQAEKRAEDRLREKEAARNKLADYKKAHEANERAMELLQEKLTAMRTEIERLNRQRTKKS